MELRGIEPLSENPAAKTSPITFCVLTFPRLSAHRQAHTLSSFICLFLPQSFGRKVGCIVDAGDSDCSRSEADGQALRLPVKNNFCRLFLKVSHDFNAAHRFCGWLSLFLELPSKPLQPLIKE